MLTEKEYKETMNERMIDVTMTAEPVVDIWPYVLQLTLDKVVLEYVFKNELIEKVYRNDNGTFEHILLPSDNSNIFIVVIVDLKQIRIKGHYRLDLIKNRTQIIEHESLPLTLFFIPLK